MKYIIMADGKGRRWNNSLGIPKHLVKINGECLLERTVRQLRERDPHCEVIITSHDERYDIDGATRYEPKNNVYEIDRFTYELIEDDICFLYGDTYYSDGCMDKIVAKDVDEMYFFGNESSIIAIKVKSSETFRKCVDTVKELFIAGKIKNCIGWHVYQCFMNYEYDVKKVGDEYMLINDETSNINRLEEFEHLQEEMVKR